MYTPCITIDFYTSTRILNSTRDCIIVIVLMHVIVQLTLSNNNTVTTRQTIYNVVYFSVNKLYSIRR